MKKILILTFLIIGLIEINYAFSDEPSNVTYGPKIYQSLAAKNQTEMEKMGVDYKKLYLIKAYQYLPFDEKTIYVLAFAKSGNYELIRLNPADPKKEIISSIREDLSESSPGFKIVIMHKLEANPFLIYDYLTRVNRKIEIFSGDEKYSFQSINNENVALKSKIFISDANTDGYPDILIWAKVSSKEKDIKNIGEMSVMLFDPQTRKFQSPILMRNLKGLALES